MVSEKMEFFLHDVFMEIMSNLDSLQDYEETVDALEEGCRLNLSSEGETEEERDERIRAADERRRQLKEALENEKEKEREGIERRIRLMDLIREYILLNEIAQMPGLGQILEKAMFIPLNAVAVTIKKRHPGKDARNIEFEREDKMLVKAELRRVRMRFDTAGGTAIQDKAKDEKAAFRKERQKVL